MIFRAARIHYADACALRPLYDHLQMLVTQIQQQILRTPIEKVCVAKFVLLFTILKSEYDRNTLRAMKSEFLGLLAFMFVHITRVLQSSAVVRKRD